LAYQFPIRFHEIDGSFYPKVFCSQCGESIRDASAAWVAFYLEDTDGIPSHAALFLHKESCIDTWQENHGLLIGTDELARMVAQLVINLWQYSPDDENLSFEAYLRMRRARKLAQKY